jgi:predicted amidohydrolase YtcJ
MVAEATTAAPSGSWILTSIGWHESNLAENRLPTLAELDAVAPDHPVLARRGGHLAVVNSAALRTAGIDADAPDSPGGRIGRLADGSRNGILEGGAVYRVAAFAPGPTRVVSGMTGCGSGA